MNYKFDKGRMKMRMFESLENNRREEDNYEEVE